MTPSRLAHGLHRAVVVAMACLPGVFLLLASLTPMSVTAGGLRSRDVVSLRVAVGYANIYRGTSWTPVRVTLRNQSGADVHGVLRIPQSDQSTSVASSPAFHALYQAPVTLAAGATKTVTVYVPGSGIEGQVSVSFWNGRTVLATGSVYPVGVDTGTLLIGVLAGSAQDYAWILPAIQHRVTAHVVRLDAATLDPEAQALSTFDVIVLTNVDSSQLDTAQTAAIRGYVQSGGSLLLVGGPSWQKTLRPLSASLLPGKLSGMRVVSNLHGLASLGGGRVRRKSVVSVLEHPTGTVWANQGGVPLVVRKQLGEGAVSYLAFDPALTGLPNGAPVLQHVVAMTAPVAITRTWASGGFRTRFDNIFRSIALTNELGNVPAATMPLLAVFAMLALLYVLFLGPANFLILRRLGRQQLALVTMPAIALLFLAAGTAVAAHLKNSSVSINTVGVVSLTGDAPQRPATLYVSLAAPLPGTYRLEYDSAGLPAALPQLSAPIGFSPRSASTIHSTPLGMNLEENTSTGVSFLALKRWATRDVTLNTSVTVPGSVTSRLGVDTQGDITGTIHNGTSLSIENPSVVAGQAIVHLRRISPGATVHVRVRPNDPLFGPDLPSIWQTVYGNSASQFSDGFGGFGFGDCCDQGPAAPDRTMTDRERNAVSVLARAQVLPPATGVALSGWTRQALGHFSVNGAAPQRRDITFVFVPLAVHLPAYGSFAIRPGMVAAHLVDILPRAPRAGCYSVGSCSGFGWGGFGGRDGADQISVGAEGSLTFELDLPRTPKVAYQQLTLSPGSRLDNLGPGAVYDWASRRWLSVDFSGSPVQLRDPARFIAAGGQVLVQLRATNSTGDLSISDQYHALNLTARGVVA